MTGAELDGKVEETKYCVARNPQMGIIACQRKRREGRRMASAIAASRVELESYKGAAALSSSISCAMGFYTLQEAVSRVLTWMDWHRRWVYGSPCSSVSSSKYPIRGYNATRSGLCRMAVGYNESQGDRSSSSWENEEFARDDALSDVGEENSIDDSIDEKSEIEASILYAFEDYFYNSVPN